MNIQFQATREDGRSFRDVAVEILKDKPTESVVSYAEIGVGLGLNPRTKIPAIQGAVRAANRILLKIHSRGVKNVPRVGYRIVPAREHMVVAHAHQSKADKALGRAVTWFDGANLEEMTQTERKTHEGLSIIAHGLAAMHSYNKGRFDRLEALFKGPIVDQK
jgi:hypothetical protein